jgi:hypothetical protein
MVAQPTFQRVSGEFRIPRENDFISLSAGSDLDPSRILQVIREQEFPV